MRPATLLSTALFIFGGHIPEQAAYGRVYGFELGQLSLDWGVGFEPPLHRACFCRLSEIVTNSPYLTPVA